MQSNLFGLTSPISAIRICLSFDQDFLKIIHPGHGLFPYDVNISVLEIKRGNKALNLTNESITEIYKKNSGPYPIIASRELSGSLGYHDYSFPKIPCPIFSFYSLIPTNSISSFYDLENKIMSIKFSSEEDIKTFEFPKFLILIFNGQYIRLPVLRYSQSESIVLLHTNLTPLPLDATSNLEYKLCELSKEY